MATIGYADLPVPAGGDGPQIPSALADLAAAVDPHLVQHVTNLADRNTTLSGAPQHTVAIANDGTTWVKTDSGSNTWITVWEPLPAWTDITLASGYQEDTYTPQVRRIGQQVWLRGRIARTDGAVIPNQGIRIGSVPTDCIPQGQIGAWAATCSLAGSVVIGVGKMEVLDVDTASALGPPGSILWWTQDGPTEAGTPWVNISGSYWID